MNYVFEFIQEKAYVIVTTSGKAEVDGFRLLNREMVGHQLWEKGMNVLFDHRKLDSTQLGSEEIQRLASSSFVFRGLRKNLKMATVVETGLGFGLTRMWEAYVENESPSNHKIFRSLEDAKRWLEEK